MSDSDILRQLIMDEAIISPHTGEYGRPTIILGEPESADHPGYSVTICGIPTDAIVIKTDMFPPPVKIFKCGNGECRRADFVIIDSKDGWVIYIELKGGKGDNHKAIQQLRGAKCVLAYCRSIGQEFWDQPNFLTENYEHRFVSISNISVSKTTSETPPDTGVHDRPENPLKISSPGRSILFKKLTGKQKTEKPKSSR